MTEETIQMNSQELPENVPEKFESASEVKNHQAVDGHYVRV